MVAQPGTGPAVAHPLKHPTMAAHAARRGRSQPAPGKRLDGAGEPRDAGSRSPRRAVDTAVPASPTSPAWLLRPGFPLTAPDVRASSAASGAGLAAEACQAPETPTPGPSSDSA